LYLNNEEHKEVDLNSIHLGNPGIGGTDYWFYSLTWFLTDYYKDVECLLFTTSKAKFKKSGAVNVRVTGVLDAITKAKKLSVDVFILNKHANVGECDLKDVCSLINRTKLKAVTVGHNFYSKKECDLIAKCDYIKRNVYVSKQQYSIYSDLDINKKDSYIWNFTPMDRVRRVGKPAGKVVTYAGSLTSTKGFHILARNWRKVLELCPDAKLNVVGSGKLYSRSSILGTYGVAEESYERLFMPHLTDANGRVIKSVKFWGLLGVKEREKIYGKTTVGVVNPSGISECCSIASIEFAANGIPVVSKRYGGLLDTVLNHKTGILVRNESQLVWAIVKFLENDKMNTVYGDNAVSFARSTFSTERNVAEWHELLMQVVDDVKPGEPDPLLIRKIKKKIYALFVQRPPLIRKESLKMPFNNYERYSKPGLQEQLIRTVRNLALFKLKLGRMLNQILIIKYGKFKGIAAEKAAAGEKLIFSGERFLLPEIRDVFGKKHQDFGACVEAIPPFYVRTFKNAFCLTNREEVISSDKRVISEYTSQKINSLIGENMGILQKAKVKAVGGKVVHLGLGGLEDNYYHFLTECLGRLYLIEKSKIKPDFYVVSNHLPFQRELLDLLGIDRKKIIPTNPKMIIQARELIVPDFLNNWEYINFRGHKYYQKKWIPSWINEIYKRKLIFRAKNSQKIRIYISRSTSDGRKIENEEEASRLFTKFGFKIFNTDKMSVKDQIKLFSRASVIAGIHGAGLANISFAPRSAKVFEIFPEYYHDASYRIHSKALGLQYYYMIGKTRKVKNVPPQQEKAYVSLKELAKALKIIVSDR